MKFLAILLTAFWAVFAFAGPADAGLVAGLWAAASVAVKASAVLTAMVQIAGSMAMSQLIMAVQGKPRAPGLQTSETQTGGTQSQSFIVGTYATAGARIAPRMTWGKSNKQLYDAVQISDTPITGISRIAINGAWRDMVPGSQHGLLTYDYGGPLYAMDLFDGTQTTASAKLLSQFGGGRERAWKPDMVGRGMAYALMYYYFNPEEHSGWPEVTFEVAGIPLYDVRKDSTAGGVGPHRWGQPETYEWTANNIVIVYNILRGITLYDGRIWGGEAEAEDLPLAVWAAAMNVCDETSPEWTGPRYRCGFEIKVADDEPADVIEELLKGCAGSITELGGVYKVRAGGPGLPVFFFTDDDLLADAGHEFTPFVGLAETINTVHATYPEPESAYESHDAPELSNAAYIAEDQGRILATSVSLPACPYGDQVQRLMRSWLEDNRRWRRHVVSLGFYAAGLEPGDTVAWSSQENGYVTKHFELAQVVENAALTQQWEIREVDPTDFDWSASFELPTFIPSITPDLPVFEVVPGWDVAPAVITDAGGVARRPALRFIWDASEIIARSIRVEIRVAGQTAVQGLTISNIDAGGVVYGEGILPDTTYQARARLVQDGKTEWSGWISATTDDLRVSVADLADDVLQDLTELQDWISGPGSSLEDRIQGVEDDAAAVRGEVEEIDGRVTAVRADLDADVADLEAQIATARTEAQIYTDTGLTEEAIARQGEVDALSARITELTSDDLIRNGSFASGLDNWTRVGTGTVTARDTASANPIIAAMPAAFAATISGAGDGLWQETETFELAASDQVQFRFSAASTSASRAVEVRVRWFDALDVEILPATTVALTLTGANVWRILSGRIPPPSGARKAHLGIYKTHAAPAVWLTNAQASTVNADVEAKIAELEAARVSADSALALLRSETLARFGNNEAAILAEATARSDADMAAANRLSAVEAVNAGQAARISENATAVVTIAESVVQLDEALSATFGAAELVPDGTFARGFEKWPVGNLGIIVPKSAAIGNLATEMPAMHALEIPPRGSDTAWRSRLTGLRPVSVGERLVMSFAYIAASTGTTPRAVVDYFDAAGNPLDTTTRVRVNAPVGGSGWRHFTLEIVAPVGAALLRAGIERLSTDAGTTRSLVTNVSLRRMQGADYLTSASIAALSQAQSDASGAIASIQETLTANYNDLDGRTSANAVAINNRYTKVQTDSAITGAIATFNSSLTDRFGEKASNTALGALTTRVGTAEGKITAQADAITSLQSAVAGKAASTAVAALTTRVGTAEGKITTQADALTALTSSVGRLSAGGRLRITTAATPTGAQARVGLHAEASDGQATHSAGMYLVAESDGTTSIIMQAQRFAMVTGTGANATRNVPFIAQGNAVYLDQAVIRDADIGTLKLAGNAVTIPVSQYLASRIAGTNTWVTASEVSITLDERAHVTAIWTATQEYESGSRVTGTRIVVDGVIRSSTQAGVISDYAAQSWAGFLNAGTHTIRVDWLGDHHSVFLENRTLIATGSKR